MNDWKRPATNLFIVSFLVLALIEIIPSYLPIQTHLKAAVDPILDKTGLWQGTWDLFAPNVDRENNWIEIRFTNQTTGEVQLWSSPRWGNVSTAGKFFRSREIEFYDRIRNQSNAAAWSGYVRYAVSHHAVDFAAGGDPIQVELISCIQLIPHPSQSEIPPIDRQVFHSEVIEP